MAAVPVLQLARRLRVSAGEHPSVWIAAMLATGLHAALLGQVLRVNLPAQGLPSSTPLAQVRLVSAQAVSVARTARVHAPATPALAPTQTDATHPRRPSSGPRLPLQPELQQAATSVNASPFTPAPADESPATPERPNAGSPTGAPMASAGAQTLITTEHLDWPPMPYSAPDTRLLDGVTASGLPMRARLLINAQGVVQDLLPLQAVLAQDERWLAQLRAMFLQTQFTPGLRDGLAVAAHLDLDITAESGLGLE